MSKRKRRGRPSLRWEMVNVADIRLGPIRQKCLPEGLQRVVRWQYRHLGYLVQPTYEQWELTFLRDLNIEEEIVIWIGMTWAVMEYLRRHPGQDKQAVARVMFGICVGREPTDEVGRELYDLVGSLPAEYKDPSSEVFDR